MEPAADTVAVNAATYARGIPVAPGSIFSLYGNFTGSATGAAPAFPLPRKIGETEVLLGGKTVPLYYASSTQVNAQTRFCVPSLAFIDRRRPDRTGERRQVSPSAFREVVQQRSVVFGRIFPADEPHQGASLQAL